jgi:hypothetical protein|tara:strand:+ start:2163 stop:2417 length:255 start_codon:yes stop_codon:yes gene_type:complete
MKLANIKKTNKNTDKLMRVLRDLNILSEPFAPPLNIPISAEPRLNKMTTRITIIIISIIFSVQLQKKDPIQGAFFKPLNNNYSQ